ncbi:MAG: YfcE family phosphodiesterase [Mycoplasmataceae bacterium]|nr:YfcE family phosphodiesterase [Mycoplasmataceae bacterium]
MNKKILILGDNHAKINIIKKIISYEKADIVIHTGDFNDRDDYGQHHMIDQDFVDQQFNYYVLGNNGSGVVAKDEAEFKKNYYNDFKVFKIGNKKILLTHGYKTLEKDGYPEIFAYRNQIIAQEKPDILICGHTHVPEIYLQNTMLVINPGSTDKPRFPSPECGTYIVVDVNNDEWFCDIKRISEIK